MDLQSKGIFQRYKSKVVLHKKLVFQSKIVEHISKYFGHIPILILKLKSSPARGFRISEALFGILLRGVKMLGITHGAQCSIFHMNVTALSVENNQI